MVYYQLQPSIPLNQSNFPLSSNFHDEHSILNSSSRNSDSVARKNAANKIFINKIYKLAVGQSSNCSSGTQLL